MLGDGNQKTLHPLTSSLFSEKKRKVKWIYFNELYKGILNMPLISSIEYKKTRLTINIGEHSSCQ